jgi:hypothetical protein
MSGADEEADRVLRVAPDLSGPEKLDPAVANADTQLMPLVNPEPAVVDPPGVSGGDPSSERAADLPTVRAVARRAAAALPALGGADGPREVPASAKITVDRRRHAQGKTAAEPAAPPAPDDLPEEVAVIGQPERSVARHGAAESVDPADQADQADQADPADQAGPVDPVDADPVDAEPAVTVVTARPVEPGQTLELARTVLGPSMADLVRPGPPPLESDSWDNHLEPANEDYQGTRRASRSARWRWLILLVVMLAVAAAVAVPLLLKGSTEPTTGQAPVPSDQRDALPAQSSTELGELVSAASSPGAGATPKATRTPAPGGGAASSPGATASRTPPRATATGVPSSFVPVTLQAEDASFTAAWQKDTSPRCGAGTPIVRTGRWTNPDMGTGTLTFTVTVATAGTYTMTIYYLITTDGARTAEVTVNSAAVAAGSFPSSSCVTTKALAVTVRQGANAIRFANPNDRGPSIDRIVISKP